jgi:hypothetical protein
MIMMMMMMLCHGMVDSGAAAVSAQAWKWHR